jgi:hypothetical protein
LRRFVPAALAALGAFLLFWNLGRPALWQDEAETALRAQSILETGLPRTTLRGVTVTAQPSLAAYEGNAAGVWTWNTWLPAYLVAGSFAVFGVTPFASRLPFALAGLLTLALWWRLCSEEADAAQANAAAALLALSPAFILFCRQSRYYALVALGTTALIFSWRRLLAGRSYGAAAVAGALNFLLHASFAFFIIGGAAVALDAALRLKEVSRENRFAYALALTAALAAPAAWYFRVWDRPGNHLYGIFESAEFLKTFLLWLAAFSVPLTLFAADSLRRPLRAALGCALLVGLAAEGTASRVCAVGVLASLCFFATREGAPSGALGLRRLCLLLIVSTLAFLSFGAAEPYGRYLTGILPAAAFLTAGTLVRLSRGRGAAAAMLVLLCSATNVFQILPLKAATLLGAPRAPAETVSGMMRWRLREVGFRSDLWRAAREIVRGPQGYIEPAAAAMKAGGGATFFSDADALSLQFATGLRSMLPDEFTSKEPDWILMSPWLRLSPEVNARISSLVASGRYSRIEASAPALLWQNNPDPLFRVFYPISATLPLLRRK